MVSEQVTLKDDKGHAEEWHGFQRQAFGAPSLGKEKPGQPSSRGRGTLSRQVKRPNPNRAGPKDTAPRPWPKTRATCPTWPGTWAPTDLGHSEVTGNPSLPAADKGGEKGDVGSASVRPGSHVSQAASRQRRTGAESRQEEGLGSAAGTGREEGSPAPRAPRAPRASSASPAPPGASGFPSLTFTATLGNVRLAALLPRKSRTSGIQVLSCFFFFFSFSKVMYKLIKENPPNLMAQRKKKTHSGALCISPCFSCRCTG